MKKFFVLILCLMLALPLAGCGKNAPSNEDLSRLVADSIISDNEGSYYEGECSAEGHKILGSSFSGNRLKVYALTMYGNYGFQNDMFVKVSGSGVIPAVLTFEKNGEEYKLLEDFYSPRYSYKIRQVWDTWIPYIKTEDRIHYRSSTLGPVGRGFDLFGDDSVLCIYTPGHTDGNFSVMINRSPSDRFKHHGGGAIGGNFAVIAGDAAFSETNLNDNVVPGYGFNREMQLKSVEFLESLRKNSYCCGMFFSHSSSDRSEIIF